MLARHERLILFVPLLLILVPFLIWPAVFGFFASFTNYAPGELHVRFTSLANYASVLEDNQFRVAWRNIIVFVLISVPAELAVGLVIAYLLREPFRGWGLVRVVLLIPWLVSPIANGVMWHFLLNLQTGLPNYWLAWFGLSELPSPLGIAGLALPTTIATDIWRKAPLASFLILPGMLTIPSEQWEFATIEGASLFSRMRHIALPWLRPLLLTIALLLIGDALGTFDSILILTGGGPGSTTLTPALYSYQQAFQANIWPIAATSAWLIVADILLVGLAYMRSVREKPR